MAVGAQPCLAGRPFKVYASPVWSVDVELIEDWLDSLDRSSWKQVMAAIEVLRENGPRLGRPLVDTLTASRHKT